MKKQLISVLAILLLLCTLFTACNTSKTPSDSGGDAPNNSGDSPTPPPAENNEPFVNTENYLPSDVFTQMKAYFESTEKGFYPYNDRASAPLVSTDVFAISNCTVKSITIPVFSTGKTDENGDFTFSIYVLHNAYSALKADMADPDDRIVITVNAEEYDLSPNSTVRKFIKVDLSEYEITLSDEQTLGFSHSDDTLIPARVLTKGTVDDLGKNKYAPAKYMIDNWDVVGYYYYDSEGGFSYTDNSLLFDFELERTYESEAAYNAMIAAKAQEDADYAAKLAAVKAAYGDKSFSLIGDSISTFNGVTNNAATHPSLAHNRVHYTINTTVYDYTKTYWGKLSVDTGMDLCVINAWSGGKCYGDNEDLIDNMLTRSYNLSTASGEDPDVIFLYYAINDMLNSPSSVNGASESDFTGNQLTGDLYLRLRDKPEGKTDKEVVDEWFAAVQQKAALAGYDVNDPSTIKRGETFITWEGAYALALQNIKRLHGDAEIYCFTLAECNHGSSGQPRMDKANTVLRALAEYFEVGLVDQSNCEINKQNSHMYARDAYGLHPNGKGHAALTKLIVETLYENLPK